MDDNSFYPPPVKIGFGEDAIVDNAKGSEYSSISSKNEEWEAGMLLSIRDWLANGKVGCVVS